MRLKIAPGWGDSYYNLAVTQELVGQFECHSRNPVNSQNERSTAITPRKSHPGTPLCRAILMFLLTIAPNIGWGQDNAPATLPPAAQEALDRGIVAAKMPDYLLAIRFFEDARKLAPEAPIIYLNLGLAESRIPGRELRAIAWFGAYLTAHADAPNAAAVKEQIAVLEVRNQSNVSNFIRRVQSAAAQMSGYKKTEALQRVAALWAHAGDITAALNTVDLVEDSSNHKSYAYYLVSEAQARRGDIAGAQRTADMIPRQTEDMRKDLVYAVMAHAAIAEAQARAGDLAGKERTLEFALGTSGNIPTGERNHALMALAQSQAKSDSTGAQKIIDLMQDDVYKESTRREVARIAARRLRSSEPVGQPVVKVYDWLHNLGDVSSLTVFLIEEAGLFKTFLGAPLKSAPFLDLAGYLNSPATYETARTSISDRLGQPDEDRRTFDALFKTAEQLVSAEIVIHRMVRTPQVMKP